jgi:integrase
MAKFRFTVRRIQAVKFPKERTRYYVYDESTPGLCLMLTSKGPQSFYVYRKIDGKPIRYRLAGFDEVTIEQARKLASDVLVKIAGGANLQKQRQAARIAAAGVPTLAALFNDYLENHAKVHLRKVSWTFYERMFKKYLAKLHNKPLVEITDQVVEKLHRTIGADHGHYQANRVLAMLSVMFRTCGKYHGLQKLWSPAAGIQRFDEHARDRILEPEELVKFWKALEGEENETLRDFFKIALFTGARKGNILAMRWDDVSIQRGEWKIPGQQTKNGQPLKIPLVPEAIEILKRRSDTPPYVFPGRNLTPKQLAEVRKLSAAGDSTRTIARNLGLSQSSVVRAIDLAYTVPPATHLQEPKFAWKRLLERAGITTRTTLHDLRRTWISAQIQAGASMAVVAASAGHKTTATTMKHYAIAGADDVRKSVGAGVAAILGTKPAAQEIKHG